MPLTNSFDRSLKVYIALSISLLFQPALPYNNILLNFERIEEQLLNEDILSVQGFRPFLKKLARKNARPSHPIGLVTLKSGLRGVFKEETQESYYYAEVAGYRASKALGLGLVPPTVFRTINGKLGSLQLYLDGPNLKKRILRNEVYNKIDPKVACDIKVFNYIFGRWDAHGGNEIALQEQDTYSLFLIDNSPMLHRTYQKYGQQAFIFQGENLTLPSPEGSLFPYEHPITLPGKEIEPLFKQYMSEKRVRKYKKRGHVTFIIWNHRMYIKFTNYRSSRSSDEIYESTLHALQRLNYRTLRPLWDELYLKSPELAEDLIQRTLERRNELIAFFARPHAKIHPTPTTR